MKYKKLKSMLKNNKEETAGLRDRLISMIHEAKEKNEDFIEFSSSYQRQLKDYSLEENQMLTISIQKHLN